MTARDKAREVRDLTAAAEPHGKAAMPWVAESMRRLEEGQAAYGQSWAGLSVAELAREVCEELADVGGWSALLLQRLDTADLSELDHRRIEVAARRALALVAEAHGVLYDASRPINGNDRGSAA